jgi:hypothetical protein
VRIAGEVGGFDPEELIGAKRSRRTARVSQVAIVAAREAVNDGGLEIGTASHGVGVAINTAVAGVPETQANVEALGASGPRAVSPFYVPSTIPNMPACEVAIDLGIHDPDTAGALACASGNAALLEARRLILGGAADTVLPAVPTLASRRSCSPGWPTWARCHSATRSQSEPVARSTTNATGSYSGRAPSCWWSRLRSQRRDGERMCTGRCPAAR